MDADKQKALDMAMRQIEKDFGKGSITVGRSQCKNEYRGNSYRSIVS